uniref:Death-associated protein n=1 Tax=Schistocephalus solidus TaxID=70667 RepID=A0A0X3P3Q0_SCHSO
MPTDDEGDMAQSIPNPPAIKVGNMRVATKHRDSNEKALTSVEYNKQAKEYNSEIVVHPQHDFLTKEELEFHDKTVRDSQNKPEPKVSKPTQPIMRICHQP